MFDELLEIHAPRLHEHLQSFPHYPHHVTFGRWIKAFFVSSFPRKFTLMFLDAIFCKGFDELRICVGILIHFQESLLYIPNVRGGSCAASDVKIGHKTAFEDIYSVLDNMKTRYKKLDGSEQEQMRRRILRAAGKVVLSNSMLCNLDLASKGEFEKLDENYRKVVFVESGEKGEKVSI